jgi:predicted TIM-barrel fold metal-dependent hydrolase
MRTTENALMANDDSYRLDIQHHFLTSKYIEALTKAGVNEAGGERYPQWTPEDSLSIMDRYEIDTAIISVPLPVWYLQNTKQAAEMARSLNEFGAQCVARWPKRFGLFAMLPLPDVDAALSEIDYALDTLHADGIVLLSNYAGIYLGDPRFEPVFAELDRRAAVVYLHPTISTGSEAPSGHFAGSPVPTIQPSVLEFVFDTTRAVANLIMSGSLRRYPHLQIILAHTGGTVPYLAGRIIDRSGIVALYQKAQAGQAASPSNEMLQQAVETAKEESLSQLSKLYYDTVFSANIHVMGSLRQLVPAKQILFGTDYPFAQEIGVRYALDELASCPGFDAQERREIEGRNALALFPRLQTELNVKPVTGLNRSVQRLEGSAG